MQESVATVVTATQLLATGWSVIPLDRGVVIGGVPYNYRLIGPGAEDRMLASDGVVKALRYRNLVPGLVASTSLPRPVSRPSFRSSSSVAMAADAEEVDE